MKLKKISKRSIVKLRKKMKKEKYSQVHPRAATRRARRKTAHISNRMSLPAPTSTIMTTCYRTNQMNKLQNTFSNRISSSQMNTTKRMTSRSKTSKRTRLKMAQRVRRIKKTMRKGKKRCSWMLTSSMRMKNKCLLPICRRSMKRIPTHSNSSRKNYKNLLNK